MTEPIDEAVAAALAGQLIVLPTDTVYGLGTRPDDAEATARLFAAKARIRELELPVLAGSIEAAEAIAVFDDRARALARSHWPGALTIVLPRSDASGAWDLGGNAETIGVRVPDHPIAVAVLARTGPLAVTSANRSGEPTPGTCDELFDIFGDGVAVYLCQADPPPGVASTVVDLTGAPTILRQGSVHLGSTLGRRSSRG